MEEFGKIKLCFWRNPPFDSTDYVKLERSAVQRDGLTSSSLIAEKNELKMKLQHAVCA